MMKKLLFLALGAVFALILYSPSYAQTPSRERLGVCIGDQMISPGEPLITVWGFFGPPDRITGILEKNKKDIYVALSYFTYGITVHLHNEDNTVQGILVQENNVNVQLAGVPFKIGDDGKLVKQAMGKPDNEESGMLVYWKRGLYVNIDGSGRISSILVALPGSTDYQPGEKEKQKPLIPS
ncbi:MAG: hypothetical protein V2A78_01830 [bacterium]